MFYKVEGLAVNGTDYATISSSVTIPASSSSATITVTPTDDSLVEFHEPVVLTLLQTNTYMLGAQKSATVTIQDDEDPALTTLVASINHPMQIEFQGTTSKYLVSLNGMPGDMDDPAIAHNNFDLMTTGGFLSVFSSLTGLVSEVKFTFPKASVNGFTNGDIYFSGGVGLVGRMAANGSGFQTNWVTLSGETNLMRGGFWIDQSGVFGGDLIAMSGGNPANLTDLDPKGGGIYRVTSAGSVTKVAQLLREDGDGRFLEGIITVTNDFARYGPLAGTIFVGAETSALLYSVPVSTNLEQIEWNFSMVPEDIDFVQPSSNWYVPDEDNNLIQKASSSAFGLFLGDLALLQERTASADRSALLVIHWTGGYYIVRKLFESQGTYENAAFGP